MWGEVEQRRTPQRPIHTYLQSSSNYYKQILRQPWNWKLYTQRQNRYQQQVLSTTQKISVQFRGSCKNPSTIQSPTSNRFLFEGQQHVQCAVPSRTHTHTYIRTHSSRVKLTALCLKPQILLNFLVNIV